MKKNLLFILFTLLTLYGYSQASKEIIYVNENFKKINFIDFQKKVESNLYHVIGVVNDSAIFKKLELKEIFGRISVKEKSQLNKLFLNRYKVDSSNIWYIHYSLNLFNRNNKSKAKYVLDDTLFTESKQKRKEYFTRKTSYGYKQTNNPDTIRKFFRIINKFELNRINNPVNTSLLHLDNMKRPPLIIIKEQQNDYYQDYNLIIKNRFNVGENMNNLIIIHPDGSYYISKNRSNFSRKELFKFNSFKREERKWRRKYEKVI